MFPIHTLSIAKQPSESEMPLANVEVAEPASDSEPAPSIPPAKVEVPTAVTVKIEERLPSKVVPVEGNPVTEPEKVTLRSWSIRLVWERAR